MSNQSLYSMRQKGVVLFIALVALLVMSLAAVALIRSVDTNSVIAGNLAFRQSALSSSDRGAEAAITWLETQALSDLTALDGDNLGASYYASYFPAADANGDGVIDSKDDVLYAKSLVDSSAVKEVTDEGESISYILQRMCLNAAPPTNDGSNRCLLGEPEIGTSSKSVKDSTEAGAIVETSLSPIYRVTVKVTGPRNTVSYSQTYVY